MKQNNLNMATDLRIPGVLNRILAFLCDYIIIAVYMGIIFLLSSTINNVLPFWDKMETSYFWAHGISFVSLTVPVFLYFFLMEKGKYQGTLGKRLCKIQVKNIQGDKPRTLNVLYRNFLKFLPWEIYHSIVFLNLKAFKEGNMTPGLILLFSTPIIISLIYFLFIVFRKDNRSLYDLASQTLLIKKISTIKPVLV